MFIYVLIDPRHHEIRYVGKTGDPLERLNQHQHPPKRGNTYAFKWLRKLQRLGVIQDLRMELVQELSDEFIDSAERFWIKEFRARGCPLVNEHEGGRGGKTKTWSAIDRERHAQTIKNSAAARAQREKLHRGNVGRQTSSTTIKLLSDRAILNKERNSAIGKDLWATGVLSKEKCAPTAISTCLCCRRVFLTTSALATHLSHVNARNNGPYPCTYCEQPCATQRSLTSHITRLHTQPRSTA